MFPCCLHLPVELPPSSHQIPCRRLSCQRQLCSSASTACSLIIACPNLSNPLLLPLPLPRHLLSRRCPPPPRSSHSCPPLPPAYSSTFIAVVYSPASPLIPPVTYSPMSPPSALPPPLPTDSSKVTLIRLQRARSSMTGFRLHDALWRWRVRTQLPRCCRKSSSTILFRQRLHFYLLLLGVFKLRTYE